MPTTGPGTVDDDNNRSARWVLAIGVVAIINERIIRR